MGNGKRHAAWIGLAMALSSRPAFAGPPYITDDPEPTDTGHFENYLYIEGTRAIGALSGPSAGVEINYGAFPDTQLTWSFPLDINPGSGGMGIVWAPLGGGIKYRFIHEDETGWRPEVALFPQISIPIGSAAHASPATELFPVWIQKNVGSWALFGGGGWTNNPGAGNRGFLSYGGAVSWQMENWLQLGAEVFGQGRSSLGAGPATAVGLAGIYDLSERWHLIGSVNTGVVNPQSDHFSYNFALKWTF